MKPHDCIIELRDVDLKVTPARLGILHILENSDVPLDVASITKFLARQKIKADKVTIFRVLNALTEKGILKPIQLNEGKLRYEYANKPEHHHFICDNCGKIIDIDGCIAEPMEQKIAKKEGVIVKRHSLEFFGLCADCIQ